MGHPRKTKTHNIIGMVTIEMVAGYRNTVGSSTIAINYAWIISAEVAKCQTPVHGDARERRNITRDQGVERSHLDLMDVL